MAIDWSDVDCKVSEYFTVGECLYLPKWDRYATETDGLSDPVKNSLIALCSKMDYVREFFEVPIVVHCAFRPVIYNDLVGGAKQSPHTRGEAMDFHVDGISCDNARTLILPSLDDLEMRMEDLPGSEWVHMDISSVIKHRFFRP